MLGRHRKLYIYFSVLILLTILTSSVNPFLKETGLQAFKAEKDPIDKKIKEKAATYDEPAEDAYIDRVWKKTPGRNGRKVDLKASLEKMKKHGSYAESLLVTKETKPGVSLTDLPPSPMYRGHPEKETVALMINVSWGEEHIPSILETLNKANVKATFFIEGKWASENKDLVEMIDEQNHQIGNHAYNHPDMKTLTDSQNKKQINKTNDILEAITEDRTHWLAPPSGSFDDSVVRVADDLGMETILWTVDTIDWQNPTVSVMIDRVKTDVHPGATVLMHPTEPVREGLEEMILYLQGEDYEIATVESLMDEKR